MMNDQISCSHKVRNTLLWVFLTSASFPASAALKLTIGEESTATGSTVNYSGGVVGVGLLDGYLLCANTPWAGATALRRSMKLKPLNPDFVFGKADDLLDDVRSFSYRVQNDASIDINRTSNTGTLGCFVTDNDGVRLGGGGYSGLFRNGFDIPLTEPLSPPLGCTAATTGSCVSVSVVEIPVATVFGRASYTYHIDYRIPAGSANYKLRDGYASDLLDPALTNCPAGVCPDTRTVDYLLTPNSPRTGRITIERLSLSNVSPAQLRAVVKKPVVIVALFPDGGAIGGEDFLSDNVAAGTGSPSDAPPNFAGLPSHFTATKGVGMGVGGVPAGSFRIEDDSIESAGSLLRATASVRFGALAGSSARTLGDLPASAVHVDCGAGVGRQMRNCSISFEPSEGFRNFATTADGDGVPAYVTLTAIDALGQATTTAPIPLLVNNGAVNTAPSYKVTPESVSVGGALISTLTCSLADLIDGRNSEACGSEGVVNLAGFLEQVRPGAIDSLDEDILQSAEVIVVGGTDGAGNRLVCDDISIFNNPSQHGQPGPPRLLATGSDSYSLSYALNGTPGVAICDVVIRDGKRNENTPVIPYSVDALQQKTSSFKLKIEFIDR